ncbi:MAG: ABC transporter ATP-binding protein [Bacteroidales bacterium]|nr:ABC transporter ATP-binding protein [Clostridium sp.]MCM1202771.1 ABC transporter ATP-binding protein [Bacteroidales bacterium]
MSKVLIEVNGLEKQYMKQKAVRDFSFQIKEGMICGLIGPNGAGKTTIMKMLGGLVLPTKGSISVYGEDTEKGLAKARSRMSFMIETPYAKEKMSARENLEKQRLQKGIPDKHRVEEVLEITGLADTGKKQVRNFSLGMRQRLGIANALLAKPEIMVLDEPINGLDPEGIVEIRELLLKLNKEEHITIIISSHILSELSLLCTDYLFIHHGELIQFIDTEGLKKMCKEHYYIHTDNDEMALAVLTERLGITDYDVAGDGGICLYEHLDNIREVSKTLYEGGVVPLALGLREANLEQYYMDMVGEQNVEYNESTKLSNQRG